MDVISTKVHFPSGSLYNELSFFVLTREGFDILSSMVIPDNNSHSSINLRCLPRAISEGDQSNNDSMNFSLFNYITEFKISNHGMMMMRRGDFGTWSEEDYPRDIYFTMVELPCRSIAFLRKNN